MCLRLISSSFLSLWVILSKQKQISDKLARMSSKDLCVEMKMTRNERNAFVFFFSFVPLPPLPPSYMAAKNSHRKIPCFKLFFFFLNLNSLDKKKIKLWFYFLI